jgi:thiamine-phosphate pyrophosphorylase
MTVQDLGADRRTRLAAARLYLVCGQASDRSAVGGRALPDLLHAAIAGGVDVVQLREKHLGDELLTEAASLAAAACEAHGALFILNDRPDIAAEVRADGVHVGQEDMPVGEVRELVGPDMLIGLSTHAPSEIDALDAIPTEIDAVAADMPATGDHQSGGPDYIGVGPVHVTPTKPGRPSVGLELVRYAAAHAPVPFFAIGGIDAEHAPDVIAAGARRLCVLRAIASAEYPEHAARTLRDLLDAHPLER